MVKLCTYRCVPCRANPLFSIRHKLIISYFCVYCFSDNAFIDTCYGSNCQTGFFQSPNYPNMYASSQNRLYLIYIPGATQIQFSFDTPFQVELNRDELYVGRGLSFNYPADLNALSNPPDKYFFEGSQTPQPFTILGDTAWIYFMADRTIAQAGFRLNWNEMGKILQYECNPMTTVCQLVERETLSLIEPINGTVQW